MPSLTTTSSFKLKVLLQFSLRQYGVEQATCRVLSQIGFPSSQRSINTSGVHLNWDKYAVGKTVQQRWQQKLNSVEGSSKGLRSGWKKQMPFRFDPAEEGDIDARRPRHQHHSIAEAIFNGLTMLLASDHVTKDLQQCPIEITKVEVPHSIRQANVFWKITSDDDNSAIEDEIRLLLFDNAERIRNMLPAFHSLTHTPNLHFYYDERQRKEAEINRLLELTKES